jgi:hypothetical protein
MLWRKRPAPWDAPPLPGRKSVVAAVLVFAAVLLCSGAARAQADVAIIEGTLRQPWELQLAVLQSLSTSITSVTDAQARAERADALAILQVALGEYESQVDMVIDRIVGDPQFAYVAAETSEALAAKVAEIHGRLGALYADLGVDARDDVRRAQNSLDELRRALQVRSWFERDVMLVMASLSRQQIVDFATRWWNGEERAIAVKKLLAQLRQRLEDEH